MMFNWETLDRIGIVLTLGAPIIYLGKKVAVLLRQREEDHLRISALWREHGYNGWDGSERRIGRPKTRVFRKGETQ